ncbi:hypothetical protein BAUCODRAFT_423234 [Baudoinia panamericana UAMH 10762]|uniref:DUF1760-domain-containing protein n=1 Tax=Baudoinia panamericana (strain UAMH 10762) TaxID=717646 RepID=M2MNX1_BAUPA|nr:uncharacterized protein BAUCODRAFT_423234 [Baudoinia panamericana UAMH 10762]EMC98391.1 hypothetical protein BAUCODRAFT_423234 [Baudoinia panamericana UAMH 10762]
MAEDESPLIKALPPESDYLTYLTIIEYNLSQENLPLLHRVLQDETLAVNIGWDLVHLLVPYLPESEQCLQDIARLGNPREVILKVTESLRLIEYESLDQDIDGPVEHALTGTPDTRVRADSSTYPIKTAPTADGEKRPGSSQMVELPPPLPLPVSQFIALLSMLSTLHARIKAKYPSRFLSTTLQAVLASFSNATTHREEMIQAIVRTVKSVAGVQRPILPARKSSGMLSSIPAVGDAPAGDPEGTTSREISTEEVSMQRKLLQSFVTHIVEQYMLNLPSSPAEDVPGMAWCTRIMESTYPELVIPGKQTISEHFQRDEGLHRRIDAIGQLVTLGRDLKLSDETLLTAAIAVEKVPAVSGSQDEDEPPASAEDIPLSRIGALLLYTARQAAGMLYDTKPAIVSTIPFAIFPDHQEILKRTLSASSPAAGTGTLGTEPESLIDAVLALGLVCLQHDSIGEPSSDEQFNEYLQVVALLSSNCPSPNLRGHAHYLTSTVLRSHPDETVRLAFIRDTLEHCPFENLKVSAVGWIKGETIEANPPSHSADHHHTNEQSESVGYEPSIFAKPLALESLAPFLFPTLHAELVTAPVIEAWQTFQAGFSFYLASLNFLYLLLCAKHLHHSLEIRDLWTDSDIAGSFLQPLRDASARFRKELTPNGALAEEVSDRTHAELNLLDETLHRVTNAVRLLNE